MGDAFRGAFDSRTPQSRQVNYNMQQELERSNALYDQNLGRLSGMSWDPGQMGESDALRYSRPTPGGTMALGYATGGLYNGGYNGRDPRIQKKNLGTGDGGYGQPAEDNSLVGQARRRADQSYNTAYTGITDAMSRGFGMDPTAKARFESMTGPMGGISDEGVNRWRGNGVFDEFSKTGGWTDQMRQDAAAKGNAPNVGIYNSLRAELGNRGNRQGFDAGGSARDLQSVRDQARLASENSRDTELGINQQVNQGRQWGTEGMSNAEKSLWNQISQNWGTGATGLQTGLEHGRGQENDMIQTLIALRNGTPGEVKMYEDLIAQMLSDRSRAAGVFTGQQAQYNPNTSYQDRMSKNLDIAGQVMGGVGGI